MVRSDIEMLAGAGRYIPERAGKRSKYMQWRGGEASYGEPCGTAAFGQCSNELSGGLLGRAAKRGWASWFVVSSAV